MFGRKKKIVNPDIAIIEADIKKRGMFLLDARMTTSSVKIKSIDEFVMFGKRNKASTVFRMKGVTSNYYFYLVDGAVVFTRIKRIIKV